MIVHNEHLPRGLGNSGGYIQELMKGRDGQFRDATIKMATRGRQQTLLHRPIQLEARCPDRQQKPINDAEKPTEKLTNDV